MNSALHASNEINAYITWANYKLKPSNSQIQDLFIDLKDGSKLALLVENLFNEKVQQSSNAKETIQAILSFLSSKKVPLFGMTPDDIINGKKNSILTFFWNLIQYCLINPISYKDLHGKQGLLQWCKEITQSYIYIKVLEYQILQPRGLIY